MDTSKICHGLEACKKNSKQSLIYEAGIKLFNIYWPRKVSVDMIVSEAGVGKGTFYNHYKNKEELYENMFDDIMDFWSSYMTMLVEKYPDPKERFMVDLLNSFEFFCDEWGIIGWLMEGNPDYFIWKINEEYLEETHKGMLKLLFFDVFDDLFKGNDKLQTFTRDMFMFYKHAQKMRNIYNTHEEFRDFMTKLAYFMVEGIFSESFKGISNITYEWYKAHIKPFNGKFQKIKKFN